ncbi:DUF2752 domain-containing protein [uncultured Streptomyces sp.]|uniref:DUF2752 domain-containing protein n=1 Tax=uncultured Streptomyces sp. TaxID=174707 RepID=UPI00261AA09B|nr:DUF2752 domain-containing protein [uncultured Streptomyces sp.]
MDATPAPAAQPPDAAPGAGPPSEPYPAGSRPPGPSGPLARRLAAPLGALAAVAGAFAYVAAVDPNEPGHYPVCPMLRLTGLLCPGCGGLRSAHAFAHGDLPAALGSNAVGVALYVAFAVFWVVWSVRAARGRPVRLAVPSGWWWGVGAVLLLFTVVRNLPFGSALAP